MPDHRLTEYFREIENRVEDLDARIAAAQIHAIRETMALAEKAEAEGKLDLALRYYAQILRIRPRAR